jgi:hypothetical protein
MLVCLNGKWKFPIGYFLQAKSTATVQAGLVQTAITMANEVGVRVWLVTCDGTSTNLSTMTQLGCKINGSYSEIFKFFTVPGIERKVFNLDLYLKKITAVFKIMYRCVMFLMQATTLILFEMLYQCIDILNVMIM